MKQKQKSDPWWVPLAGFILSLYIRLIFFTGRKRYLFPENMTQFFESGEQFILVAFHNRNILSVFGYTSLAPRKRILRPMASASKDGSIAASAMDWLGCPCVRGSSSRGGAKALRQMLRIFKDKRHDLAITPDGPRGPMYSVHPGVVHVARMTGAPVVPLSYFPRRCKRLKSWDRMIVPSLFTRLVYAYGEPIRVPRGCSEEEIGHYTELIQKETVRIGELTEHTALEEPHGKR